ncbi:MAG: hypothetical protein K8F60_18615 [Melioribacteraceae bacterium]|nr:hypothetical protein [Melioribacteraceae bacterium]
MYSPKLREDLVSALYRLKQVKKKPMTKLLNEAVEQYVLLETGTSGTIGTKGGRNEEFLRRTA